MRLVSWVGAATLWVALPQAAHSTPEGERGGGGQLLVACGMNLGFACVLLEHGRIESGHRPEAEARLIERCANGSVNACRYLDFFLPDRKTPSCRSWLDAAEEERRYVLIDLSRDHPEYGDRYVPRGNLLVPETELDALIPAMVDFCTKHERLQLHEALWLKTVAHGDSSPDELAKYWALVRRGETEAAVRDYLNARSDRLNSARERKRYGCSPPQGTRGRIQVTSEPPGATIYLGERLLDARPLSKESVPTGCHTLIVVFPSGVQKRVKVEIEPERTVSYRVHE